MGRIYDASIIGCAFFVGYLMVLLATIGLVPPAVTSLMMELFIIAFLASIALLLLYGLIVVFILPDSYEVARKRRPRPQPQPQEVREEEDYETAWQGWEEDAAWNTHETEPARSWECARIPMEQRHR